MADTPNTLCDGDNLNVLKSHILNEIKRVAQSSEGNPPDGDKFATATGIAKHLWLGKIWARWSDALREAGFSPNQLTPAYDKTALLKIYADLALKLGRLPAQADVAMSRTSDPRIPRYETLHRRFGSKATLVRDLLVYCQDREGYEDVVGWCEGYAPSRPAVPETIDQEDIEFGFVYLIKSGRFYKIGRSNSSGRREYELAIQLPEKATAVHAIRTDDAPGIENYWHRRFAEKRKNGEWFELDASDIAAFKRRKFM